MFLFEHDLRANAFGVCRERKPLRTFPDHALSPDFSMKRTVAGARSTGAQSRSLDRIGGSSALARGVGPQHSSSDAALPIRRFYNRAPNPPLILAEDKVGRLEARTALRPAEPGAQQQEEVAAAVAEPGAQQQEEVAAAVAEPGAQQEEAAVAAEPGAQQAAAAVVAAEPGAQQEAAAVVAAEPGAQQEAAVVVAAPVAQQEAVVVAAVAPDAQLQVVAAVAAEPDAQQAAAMVSD
jgi:hypothetical protein